MTYTNVIHNRNTARICSFLKQRKHPSLHSLNDFNQPKETKILRYIEMCTDRSHAVFITFNQNMNRVI